MLQLCRHDRDERLKLRNEYNERMETISTRRRYHSMPEDEKALIQDIREKIHDSQDEDEKAELRHEIEEIYMKHREERNTKGHMDDVHRPDVGMHRLEYNDMLHESDSQLLSYHDQVRCAVVSTVAECRRSTIYYSAVFVVAQGQECRRTTIDSH